MKKLTLLAVIFATPTFSQDLTHPLEMGLPESSYTRPDPVEYQLVLENGLVSFVAEADQVPLVTISAFIRAGRGTDEDQGAAESLQDALKNSGPSGMSSGDFRAGLKQMVAEYTVNLHDEWMEISLNVPAEDLDQALRIFAGLLRSLSISDANIESAAGSVAPVPDDPEAESGQELYDGSMSEAVDRFYEILSKAGRALLLACENQFDQFVPVLGISRPGGDQRVDQLRDNPVSFIRFQFGNDGTLGHDLGQFHRRVLSVGFSDSQPAVYPLNPSIVAIPFALRDQSFRTDRRPWHGR